MQATPASTCAPSSVSTTCGNDGNATVSTASQLSSRSQPRVSERNQVASELSEQLNFETLREKDFIDAEACRGGLELRLQKMKTSITPQAIALCKAIEGDLSEAQKAFNAGDFAKVFSHAQAAKTTQTDLLVLLHEMSTESQNSAADNRVAHCCEVCKGLAKLISILVVVGEKHPDARAHHPSPTQPACRS